jgi:hypothetical protein
MGALFGGPVIPPDSWDQKWITHKQIQRIRRVQQFGTSCSEAPCGAAEQSPGEQRAGETPLNREKHLSIGGG